MHMADALLSPTVGATFWATSLGTIAWCAKRPKENINEKIVPLMGVLGAFIFAAQMINFTIPGTGSSGHLGGGMILTILLGPYAGFIVMASVLIIQALFFADGGLLALGCNIWNLGFYPCFIAYPFIYKSLVQGGNPKRVTIASMISAVIALQLGAFSVVIETLLSGRSELQFGTFLLLMQPIHLAIGIIEGFITAGVINLVRTVKPEMETALLGQSIPVNTSVKRVFAGFLVIAILVGGILSWFASTNPDGLEWSIEKVFGKPELPEHEGRLTSFLKMVQEKIAILPDYDFRNRESSSEDRWPNVGLGTSLSGMIGSIMVLCLIVVLGIGIKLIRQRRVDSDKH
ncbi:MAG: energy-coupling factor ABC transporter permease [Thermodesulfovibrionia bacterium]